MPRTAAANQRIRDGQRARILDGARRVFARRGLAATMAEVAAAAGVSQGLAYRYFAGKDELFRALLADSIRSSEGPAAVEAPGSPRSPGERLHALVSALVTSRREQPELFQLLHHVMADEAVPADLLELVERKGREFQATMRALVVEGQAAGEVAEGDPDQLVTAVTACIDGLSRPGIRIGAFPSPGIVMRLLMRGRP
jgi:AcrR family transcriptional regulator